MAHVIYSLERLAVYLIFIVILSIGTLYVFDLFVAAPISLPMLLIQAIRVIIILGFWLTAIMLLRRIKPLMTPKIGIQAATILQFAMLALAVLVIIFGVLNTLGVSPTALLTSAGIISITAGLVISTFVGSLLSGALVFTTYQFKVGDDVMVNNIPGRVTDMTALVMRIRTDVGQISIPNSAIASGGVIITAIHKFEGKQESRIPYTKGDRVITSFMNEQGIIKELTPLHTVVLLDSGKEITFLNNSVLSGAVPIAKITQASSQTERKTAQS
ncbi:MAG: mechanosensitive ion channel domain-containing protein [Candidatus Bathyarchaeia archaeon]|jgi:small-conductance mechanosensitive channel